MKVLLDECVDAVLANLLVGVEVFTVAERGWGGVTNGATGTDHPMIV